MSVKAGGLKSIAITAPYLGLAGTCVGLLNIFNGTAASATDYVAMTSSVVAAAFISSAAGLLVAVPAVVSYNHLRRRIDSLEGEVYSRAIKRPGRHSQLAQKFPLTKRFSQLPFPLIAVPILAISAAAFTTFSSFHTPKGLPVRLVKIGVIEAEQLPVERIVIEITGARGDGSPVVYVNSTKTPSDELESRLRSELEIRPQLLASVQAKDNVSWRDVVSVIDVVEGVHASVVLLTITPNIGVARKSTR